MAEVFTGHVMASDKRGHTGEWELIGMGDEFFCILKLEMLLLFNASY